MRRGAFCRGVLTTRGVFVLNFRQQIFNHYQTIGFPMSDSRYKTANYYARAVVIGFLLWFVSIFIMSFLTLNRLVTLA